MSEASRPKLPESDIPRCPVAWGLAHAFELLREARRSGVIYAGVRFSQPAAEPEKGAKKP